MEISQVVLDKFTSGLPPMTVASFDIQRKRLGTPIVKRSDHVTPLFKTLHWLSVERRIQFKILITYKTLHGQSANYLMPLIDEYHPS